MTVAAVEADVPPLIDVRTLLERFHVMIQHKFEADLQPWIDESRANLVAS